MSQFSKEMGLYVTWFDCDNESEEETNNIVMTYSGRCESETEVEKQFGDEQQQRRMYFLFAQWKEYCGFCGLCWFKCNGEREIT